MRPGRILAELQSKRRPASYQEQTHESPWWIVRFAHRRRHDASIALLVSAADGVLFDYGAGDGEVVARLLETCARPPAHVVLLEPEPGMREHARERLARTPFADRVTIESTLDDALAALGDSPVDVVACLGVLEHLTLDERLRFYGFVERRLALDGTLVINVPVEIGPTLLVKQLGRRLLKGRGAEYSAREFLARVLGRRARDPERLARGTGGHYILSHRGFDYRQILAEVRERWDVFDLKATPMAVLPPWMLNQEVVFRARRRPELHFPAAEQSPLSRSL